ncbi:hypothetical protein GCM10010425_59200 [Streptomyces spororaveus]|uniref:Uncharacterized protein n=1 Tax=Streptomyces spororaveus TaxID=284039 RepID=A0ABQ3T765_9ACTN|nr:hypothetical protein Sspor_17700 [Streptomyces spororaveus]
MPYPLIRLSIGRTNGVAHYGVIFGSGEPLTACATHSSDLAPIGDGTSHQTCQSCTRALLVLNTGHEIRVRCAEFLDPAVLEVALSLTQSDSRELTQRSSAIAMY